jgi:hypothetical protein
MLLLNIKNIYVFPTIDANLTPLYYVHTLQRKSHLCISFLGIARHQPQFKHSFVCERFIQSQDRSTYFLQQNRRMWEYINRSQTHECGKWEWDPDIPFLKIFVSKFLYLVYAVQVISVQLVKFLLHGNGCYQRLFIQNPIIFIKDLLSVYCISTQNTHNG